MLKVNLEKIKKYLNEFEMINNNIRNYLLESETRIIEKISLIDRLNSEIDKKIVSK